VHLYASYRIDSVPLSVGFGLNNPFGLGTYWPGDWDGRFIGTETEIQTFFSQPVVALDLATLMGFTDKLKLSVALGYNLVYGTARLSKKTDLRVGELFSRGELEAPEAELRMLGDAVGHGWNLALFAEIPGLVSAGLSVRSNVDMRFSGTARFVLDADARATVDMLGMSLPDETTGTVDIELPYNLNFGLAFLSIPDLVITGDVYVAFFSSYDELTLRFDCVEEGSCTDSLNAEPIETNWRSSWQLSLGAEYTLTPSWTLRAGAGMVTSPVPDETYDPALPDGLRTLVSAGFGYAASFWRVDVGYMLAWWEGEKDNRVGEGDEVNPEGMANGTYSTVTHLLAVSMSAWF
jgi:long-chain fatty acid transport protein